MLDYPGIPTNMPVSGKRDHARGQPMTPRMHERGSTLPETVVVMGGSWRSCSGSSTSVGLSTPKGSSPAPRARARAGRSCADRNARSWTTAPPTGSTDLQPYVQSLSEGAMTPRENHRNLKLPECLLQSRATNAAGMRRQGDGDNIRLTSCCHSYRACNHHVEHLGDGHLELSGRGTSSAAASAGATWRVGRRMGNTSGVEITEDDCR